jgi:hypothetical protein
MNRNLYICPLSLGVLGGSFLAYSVLTSSIVKIVREILYRWEKGKNKPLKNAYYRIMS